MKHTLTYVLFSGVTDKDINMDLNIFTESQDDSKYQDELDT